MTESTEKHNQGDQLGAVVDATVRPLDTGFALLSIVRHILANARLIILFVLGALLLGAVYAFLATPVYRADVLVAPADRGGAGGNIASLASQFSGLASLGGISVSSSLNEKDEVLAIIRSREFTKNFIAQHDLLPILFSDKWSESENDWSVDSLSDIPTDADAYKKFNERVRMVTEDRQTGLIRISISWSDRDLAALWANSLVELLNDEVRDREVQLAQDSLRFLNAELEKATVIATQQAIFQLVQHEIEKVMLANVREQYALIVLDKAVVPDIDRPEKPRKLLVLASSGFLGLIFALAILFLRLQFTEASKSNLPQK